ncbi:TonB-dependent receptor [Polaribacter sargassicola]|uniref:TonB-dependent receptor n=1 Tax=Polaribacter sargassicola TaxID=2836891 RepID=UPI001F15F8B7|nr:TonB-dependent receptor [Polaribacter sp. DS7-9]MCG1036119.1 TonB-dependent receptor [Polaribacter sp. DS7-9]
MKNKLTLLLLVAITSLGFSQNATVSGKITDNSKTEIIGVNTYLKNTIIGTETNEKGEFTISNINTGKHTLVISYLGYKTKEIPFTITNNEVKDFGTIILFEGNELLQEVTLTSRDNKFSRKNTAYVSKLPLKDLENSHVYSTVTSDLLESQIVTNLDDAMQNATGVYKLWEATGRGPGNGTSYFSTRGFSVQPRLINGVSGITFSEVDPSYIERIEVIKGPSATLFGSTETSLGGLINVVTKKPFQGFGGSISYTGGSFGMHRLSADVNTPIGNSDDLFFRINTSYLTQDSFQDAGFKNTFFVAPSLSYRVNNKLNLTAGIEFSRTEQTNPSMLFLGKGTPLVSTNIEELNIDPNKSFTSNDITLDNDVYNTRFVVDYKISDKWTSQTTFSSSYAETGGYYQYQFDGGAAGLLQLVALYDVPGLQDLISPFVDPMLYEASTLLQQNAFTRVYSKRDADQTRYNLQQNFIGDFKIGKVRNRFVFGIDYLNDLRNNRNVNGNTVLTSTSNFPALLNYLNNFPYADLSAVAQTIEASFAGFPFFDAFLSPNGNVISTSFTPNATYSPPTKAQLDANFNQIEPFTNRQTSKTIATYVSDVINVTPNLTVNLGLRLDHFIQDGRDDIAEDDFTKTTLSPTAGILYQPIKNKLSLFTNYQTGFVNVDPVVNADNTVDVFQPQKAVQIEAGIKTQLFNSKLNLGASYYHITVDDFTAQDPTERLFNTTIDIAQAVSKGWELELNANPFNGLNIRGSYSFNDMKYTDVYSEKAGRDITEFEGRRPESAGAETLYNFWADYKFQKGSFAENFGFGIGFNGASESLPINNALTGAFTIPSYTIYNASIYYDANKFRIGLKANNFTDKIYYTGWTTVNAQAPRSFVGTVSYKF